MQRILETVGKQCLDIARRGTPNGLGLSNPAAVQAALEAAADISHADRTAAVLVAVGALVARPHADDPAALVQAIRAALARAREAAGAIDAGGAHGEG